MLLPIICAALLAAAQAPADGKVLRATLKSSERTIDDRIQQVTSRAPFVLLGTTRGAYLAGYGAVFTLEVNLVPVANISPFRPAYSAQEIEKLNRDKREKLGALRAAARQLLVEQAAQLGQIPLNEKIAIVLTLFNFKWENTTGLPSQVVLQAQKQALLDASRAGPQAVERVIDSRDF